MKSKFSKNNIVRVLIVSIVVILQLCAMGYWINQKANFYIDEFYSFGYASSFTKVGDTSRYITYSDKWTYDNWISNAELKEFMYVSDEESLLKQPVWTIARRMLFEWNYMGFLNLANHAYDTQSVGVWPGIILNMIFLSLTYVVMISLMKKLKINDWTILCGIILYGFSSLFLGIATYVRFYCLTLLLLWCTVWLFYKLWEEDRISHIIICEVLSFITIVMSINNSGLTMVICAMMVGVYMLKMLCEKNWKKLFIFIPEGVGLLAFLALGTSYLDILLRPNSYASTGGAEGWTTSNVVNSSFASILRYLGWIYNLIADKVFGNNLILIAFIILLLVSIKLITAGKKRYSIAWWQMLSVVLVTGTTRMAFINGHNRSICLLLLILMIAWAIIRPLYGQIRECNYSSDTWFILAIGLTGLVYTLFCSLAFLDESRYYSFAIILIFLCAVYIIDKAMKQMKCGSKKIFGAILMFLSIVAAILPFKSRNIDFIYENEKEIIAKIQEYKDLDIVLTAPIDPSGVDIRHEAYECIYWMSDRSRIYPIELENYSLDIDDSSKEIVLWTHRETNVAEIMDELKMLGFDIECLGETHVSRVYVCHR